MNPYGMSFGGMSMAGLKQQENLRPKDQNSVMASREKDKRTIINNTIHLHREDGRTTVIANPPEEAQDARMTPDPHNDPRNGYLAVSTPRHAKEGRVHKLFERRAVPVHKPPRAAPVLVEWGLSSRARGHQRAHPCPAAPC